jgi:hypothetical protein
MRMVIDTFAREYRRYRRIGESAIAQVDDAHLHRTHGGEEGTSLAILVRHVGGNLRSRFTDFFDEDGEKPWRHREGEFIDERLPRAELMAAWTDGWIALERVLAGLDDADFARLVTVRGQHLTIADALARSHAHIAYHVGQIVLIARAHLGGRWRSLSIPKGGSVAYNAAPTRERG